MNALEDRLRDALETAAGTVPDTATGPGLALEGRRTHRPARRTLVVLGAAAAVVAAVAIPLAIHAGKDQRDGLPAGPVCPTPSPVQPSLPTSGSAFPEDGAYLKLPPGPPPQIPYIVTGKSGPRYLQDGDVRVPLAAGKRVSLYGRVGCGWVVDLGPLGRKGGDIGVLKPDGTFERRSASARAVAISPDRTQIAVVPEGSRRLSVIDLGTGDEVTARQVAAETGAYTWTKDGIWYSDEGYHEYAYVWAPGAEPRKVTHNGDEFFPRENTDLIMLQEVPKAGTDNRCTQVLTLPPAGGTRVVMQRCGEEDSRGTLSPDGRFLVTESGTAYSVVDNTSRRAWPATLGHLARPVAWDDAQHVLLKETLEGDGKRRTVVVRCDVLTSACERVYFANGEDELDFGWTW